MSTDNSGKISGAALIVGAIAGIVTMSIHPTGIHLDADAAGLAAQADVTRLAHGIALTAMPMTLFGLAEFSRRLGLQRPAAMAGLIFYAFGIVAVMSAALMSGFVQASLMDAFARADSATKPLTEPLMSYTHMINQAYAMVYAMASAAGILIWSLGLLALKRERVLGWLGVAVGVGEAALTLFGGHDALSVHGFMALAIGEGAWLIGVGLLLWRGMKSEPADAV